MNALRNLVYAIPVFFIVVTSGCVHHQVKVPQWYASPDREPGYYYGLGEGGSYEAARTMALGSLCRSIHVNIRTSIGIVRQQVVTAENDEQTVLFKQIEESMNRASARCSFKGRITRLIREVRSQERNGRYYVKLKMSMSGYVRFLPQRTVVIRVRPDRFAELTEPLVQVVMDVLRDDNFVVVEPGGRPARFLKELIFEPKIQDTGVSRLKTGRVQPVFKLVDTKGRRLLKRVCPGTFTARGFEDSLIVEKLVTASAKALRHRLMETSE